jgi:hypothetical protein
MPGSELPRERGAQPSPPAQGSADVTLSRPQVNALRYVKGRQLYASDINEGNGNLRRTILWLLDRGLLGWDPIYQGRVVLTETGVQALTAVREIDLAAREKLGVMDLRKIQKIEKRELAARQTLRRVVREAKETKSCRP